MKFSLTTVACLASLCVWDDTIFFRLNWITGYKILLLIAALQPLIAYTYFKMNMTLETIRELQYATLSTTSKGDALALFREERMVESNCIQGMKTSHDRQTPVLTGKVLFTPQDQYDPPSIFWCTYTSVFVLYNTLHLFMVPLSYIWPLVFGTPAFMLYLSIIRTFQIFPS